MLNNDQLAIIAILDAQLDTVISALVDAKGNEVETACLMADYDSLQERIAAIRAEALDTAEMEIKRADRLAELGNLNRSIDAKSKALATKTGESWTLAYSDLCDVVAHRNAIGTELNAMVGVRMW